MDKLEIIKKTIKELLEKMNFESEIIIDGQDENNLVVNVQTSQAGFLIGQAGTSLEALQHLARVLVSKKISQPIYFILDVNDYRKHRLELLRQLAKSIAQQALTEKATLTLQPMPAFERRIIHLTLADNPQVITESIGQEPERKIVIKPAK